jgi:hypothetical protein
MQMLVFEQLVLLEVFTWSLWSVVCFHSVIFEFLLVGATNRLQT